MTSIFQNDALSALSPAELPTPQESKVEPEPDDSTDASTHLARYEQDFYELL